MWMLLIPSRLSSHSSSMISSGERSAHAELIGDVLDAVGAAGRAAPAGDDEGERTLDQRHAVLLQRQQVVQRDRQVVSRSGNERPRGVDDDLVAAPPDQPLDPCKVHGARRVD